MNKFDTNPERLFSGKFRWIGINNPVLAIFGAQPEAELLNAVTEWPSIVGETCPRATIFSAHLIKLLISDNPSLFESISVEQEAVKARFVDNKFEEWLPPEEIDAAWLGGRYGSAGNWSLIGVTEQVVVSAFARQFWLPALTYGDGRLSAVSMHVKPVDAELADQIGSAVL